MEKSTYIHFILTHISLTGSVGTNSKGKCFNNPVAYSLNAKTFFSVACSKVPNSVLVKGLKPMTVWKDRYSLTPP